MATPTRLNRDIQHPPVPNFLRPPIASQVGTGILTCFPSATHFCLALGADSPCADERCAGNLGLPASGLFTRFIATHVSIRTSDTSSSPHEPPSQAYGTLSYHVCLIQTSCLMLITPRPARPVHEALWSRPRRWRLTWLPAKLASPKLCSFDKLFESGTHP